MIKLALVGKNIQHSRSPEIYKRLLGTNVQYDLLDYENPGLIPSATELMSKYDGINITSPYKKHFLDQVNLSAGTALLDSINCLKKENGKLFGENTDFLAVVDILQKFKKDFGILDVVVLGDGVMSRVVQVALKKLGIEFKICSRKTEDILDQLNITEIFDKEFNDFNQRIVINTCSRDFIFKGQIDKKTIFWDLNYNFTPHLGSLSLKTKQYIDGLEMLELQAAYAISFWSIKASDLNN